MIESHMAIKKKNLTAYAMEILYKSIFILPVL